MCVLFCEQASLPINSVLYFSFIIFYFPSNVYAHGLCFVVLVKIVLSYIAIQSFHANKFRDWDELRYSMRSLLRYAPWVGTIYIVVADGQVWL